MAYTKTNWSNGETALSDVNMNHIETGIKDAHDLIDALKAVGGEFILSLYPVGSILMNATGTNPGTYLGGTWEAWGSGRVPVGVNASDTSFDTSEKTGGEKTHTLTPAETAMKAHNHTMTHYHNMDHVHNISHAHEPSSGARFLTAGVAGEGETYGGSLSGSGYKLPHIAANYSFYWPGATGGATKNYSGNPDPSRTSQGSSNNTSSTTAANGNAHNNLQPYITCYMFKRTA